jgi:hypothetical protein
MAFTGRMSVWPLRDVLGNGRVWPHRLDKNYLVRIYVHPVGFVQFLATLDEYVADLLGVWVRLTDDVEDVRQDRVRSSITLQMPEIDRTVREQHGLVRGAEPDGISSNGVVNVKPQGHKDQKTHKHPDSASQTDSPLVVSHGPLLCHYFPFRKRTKGKRTNSEE